MSTLNVTKHIFIFSASLSGLGKGVVSASIGRILKSYGHNVTIQKFDPYLNVFVNDIDPDAHGECIRLKDGWVGDMDLFNYSNFLDDPYLLTKNNSITSGIIYNNIFQNERNGKYAGQTIQIIPHVTDEIKRYIHLFDEQYDVVIHEIGGNINDIEAAPHIETIRQLQSELNHEDCLIILLVYLPFLKTTQEVKTKIAQQGVEACRSSGIIPDILIARSEEDFDDEIKEKLSLFTNIKPKYIIKNLDAQSIYNIPKMLADEGIITALKNKLKLSFDNDDDFNYWNASVLDHYSPDTINIGIFTKSFKLKDSYISIAEALRFAGWKNKVNINTILLDAKQLEITPISSLKLNGVLIPDISNKDDFYEKMTFVKICREQNIPTLGIGSGAEAMICEFANNVLKLKNALPENIAKQKLLTDYHIIFNTVINDDIGDYSSKLINSILVDWYENKTVTLRHRYINQFNKKYQLLFKANNMYVTATSDNDIVDIMELKNHSFFVSIFGHPELLTAPLQSNGIFDAFVFHAKHIGNSKRIS